MLVILDELLQKSPITPIDIIHFKVLQPSAVDEIFNEGKEGNSEIKGEGNEAKEGGSSVGR